MNLRDLSDDDLLCDLIGGTFTATDAAELARRLAVLREQRDEAENEVGRLIPELSSATARALAAEADRDRLAAKEEASR